MIKLIICFIVCTITLYGGSFLDSVLENDDIGICLYFGGMFYMWFLNKMDDLENTLKEPK